ncbi:DUF2637 domain-containing protein (plasmid) [Streptomyces chartreusis]|nr:DUF2637 domain-containing protein [Streptomyces chartreusis]
MTRTHRWLIGVVVTGAVIIAGIGFAGSYASVRELAARKGFGDFAYFFPIGIDAGIVVLLGLDLLLTWIRIPFPMLRQTAWLLTAATIAFNGAAAWPDPLGVGMHAVIPVLFVVAVEAARHAIGRIADITADKHMEGVRLTRWLLSPLPTFLLWRRMKLWELRSYEQVIKMEQERLVYQARLRNRFGRAWRRKAPVEALMPLRLSRYGVPLRETAAAGLEAAGIPVPAELERLGVADVREELPATPSAPELETARVEADDHGRDEESGALAGETAGHPAQHPGPVLDPSEASEPWAEVDYRSGYGPYGANAPAAAGASAAHNERRPRVVQARIDVQEWEVDAREVLDQSPIGDGQRVPFVPGPATEPVLGESAPVDEGEVSGLDSEPDGLTGVDLLEHRYLRLSPDQRKLSAVKIAELLYEGTGFTAGTARKYLGEIIRKHR